MNKLKLIIAREYMTTVARKSFIFTTLLVPVIMILCMGLPALIAYYNQSGGDVETVAVIDASGRYGTAIHDTEQYHFVVMSADTIADPYKFYNSSDKSLAAIVMIPRDIDSTAQATVFSESTINVTLKSHINNALSDTISQTRLLSYGVPNLQEMVDKANVDVDLKSVKWSESGSETESSTEMAMILGMVLSLLTYTFVLMYGAMIMNGVIEEKTNRIVEVIVSSCKPFELMMGKIIGVALVGLTQLAIWGVIMGVLSLVLGSIFGADVMTGGQAQAGMQAMQEMGDSVDMAAIFKAVMSINYPMIITNFIIYFVGGYLLYAALFAAFGSAVDQAADASQFTTPIILIMIVALYAGIACIENPNGPMAVWCSIIPFTSPVVMMVRLPYDVPFWQIALSVVLLYATACAVVWIAGRIYRTGILLYGKKTSFKEILRWIK